jgi:serine/threonine protein kinase
VLSVAASESTPAAQSASVAESVSTKEITLNESIVGEREKIIKFIKAYIKRHNEIPPTTLDYYKFVKLIGKGAFGKVTLGIHKLTGKYVAIKTIDKSYMKDEYSRRKVF